jgi:hypothetical protein
MNLDKNHYTPQVKYTRAMRFASVLGLFMGLASATPILVSVAPNIKDVKIISISATGSGCPVGHAQVTVDATGTIFDIAFDQYTVTVGPGSGASDNRKNCRVSINLQFPSGYQ